MPSTSCPALTVQLEPRLPRNPRLSSSATPPSMTLRHTHPGLILCARWSHTAWLGGACTLLHGLTVLHVERTSEKDGGAVLRAIPSRDQTAPVLPRHLSGSLPHQVDRYASLSPNPGHLRRKHTHTHTHEIQLLSLLLWRQTLPHSAPQLVLRRRRNTNTYICVVYLCVAVSKSVSSEQSRALLF